jgi:hypothetical protein
MKGLNNFSQFESRDRSQVLMRETEKKAQFSLLSKLTVTVILLYLIPFLGGGVVGQIFRVLVRTLKDRVIAPCI